MEGGGGDLLSDNGGLVEILNNYSLPMRPININEYGTAPEQVRIVLSPTTPASCYQSESASRILDGAFRDASKLVIESSM